jgi:hypothetical protein
MSLMAIPVILIAVNFSTGKQVYSNGLKIMSSSGQETEDLQKHLWKDVFGECYFDNRANGVRLYMFFLTLLISYYSSARHFLS